MKTLWILTVFISSNWIPVNPYPNSESQEATSDKSVNQISDPFKQSGMQSQSLLQTGASCFPAGLKFKLEAKTCHCIADKQGKTTDFMFFSVPHSLWDCDLKPKTNKSSKKKKNSKAMPKSSSSEEDLMESLRKSNPSRNFTSPWTTGPRNSSSDNSSIPTTPSNPLVKNPVKPSRRKKARDSSER